MRVPVLHTLANACYFPPFSFSLTADPGVGQLTVAFDRHFLMGRPPVFWAICVSYLEKCLFKSLANWMVFLLFSSLRILDTGFLSHM